MTHLGKLLNTARLICRCPQCKGHGPLQVYEHAAVWACCGRQHALRPLPAPPRKTYRNKKGEQ